MASIRVMLVDEQRERQAAVAELLAYVDCELIAALASADDLLEMVDAIQAKRVRPILEAALACFEQFQRLEQALDKARGELAERKRVERAKGIVMAQRGLKDEEAYRLLGKAATDQNKRLAEIAEAVIAAAELLGSTPKAS